MIASLASKGIKQGRTGQPLSQMELGKESSGEESAEYFSYTELLIIRFSAQQVPVMKGN